MTPQSPAPQTAGEAMHRGVITTAPQTPVQELTKLMANHRVHCVVVEGLARGRDIQEEELVWGIVSDLDLIKTLAAGRGELSAGDVAASEIITVQESEPIEHVMQLMAEHECTHLVVISREGEPTGVISTLDVAGALAEAQERAS